MPVVTIDFETFYSQEYSLRRMSEVDYILDPRFQTILCTVKEGTGPTDMFVGHKAVAERFARIDWTRAMMLAHNTRFDGAILAWHYGIIPAMYGCTLSMARALTHAVIGRSSLEKVSEYLGLPPKGDEVLRAIGMRLEAFSPSEIDRYGRYSMRDTDNCKAIFDRFLPVFPRAELRLIDIVMRMFIEPQVFLDAGVLAAYLHAVRAQKAAIMGQVAHIDKSTFSSNAKFAALLESYGVEVPQKISPATGEIMPALAKGDRAFKELCSDDTQSLEVQTLLAARVSAKSTLEETRTESLLNLSLREWPVPQLICDSGLDAETWDAAKYHGLLPSRGTGWAPVPLKFYGAHTGRLSGDGGFNWQNFSRGSQIRAAVVAPEGYRILHRDASQIEARMVAFLANCLPLLQAFAEDRDIYSEFASEVYGRHVTRANKGDRFVGKTSILGLGYGMGPPRFRHTLFIGNGGISVSIDEREAGRIVYLYRKRYEEIPNLWTSGGLALDRMINLSQPVMPLGRVSAANRKSLLDRSEPFPVITVGHEAIWLPNGMSIAYPGIRQTHSRMANGKVQDEIVYNDPYGGQRRMFGGKFVENVSQALARIIVTDIAVRVYHDTGYHPFLTTHDSLDYCVPLDQVEDMDARLEHEFSIRPDWAPTLPLASEGGWGVNLLQAEKAENV